MSLPGQCPMAGRSRSSLMEISISSKFSSPKRAIREIVVGSFCVFLQRIRLSILGQKVWTREPLA